MASRSQIEREGAKEVNEEEDEEEAEEIMANVAKTATNGIE